MGLVTYSSTQDRILSTVQNLCNYASYTVLFDS
jgi:hypothetical protein